MVLIAIVGEISDFIKIYVGQSKNMDWGLSILLFVLYAILWPSDHSMDQPEPGLIFHVIYASLGLLLAFITYIYVFKIKFTKVIDLVDRDDNTVNLLSKKSNIEKSYFDVSTTFYVRLFAIAMLAIIGCVNLFLGRYEFGSGGMSPIGACPSSKFYFGIPIVIVAGIIAGYAFFKILQIRREAIVSLKYILLNMLLPSSWMIHDILATESMLEPYGSAIIFFFCYLVIWILYGVLAYFIEVETKTSYIIDIYYKDFKNIMFLYRTLMLYNLLGTLITCIIIASFNSSSNFTGVYITAGLQVALGIVFCIIPVNKEIK